jgi:hypothetical protein
MQIPLYKAYVLLYQAPCAKARKKAIKLRRSIWIDARPPWLSLTAV